MKIPPPSPATPAASVPDARTASRSPDLAMPAGLSPIGVEAWHVITAYLKANGLTWTGGCRAFYSPAEWRGRGEQYGCDSELIVVYDGGQVREPFDPNGGSCAHEDEMARALREIGAYPERCACWYSAIYLSPPPVSSASTASRDARFAEQIKSP